MKYRKRRLLALLVGGMLLLAFMIPGMAEEQKKSKGKSDSATAAANSAAISAPLKAKSNPKVIANKRAPIEGTPYKPSDFTDPNTGKPATATTVLTLPTGRKVRADKYVAAINRFEKSMNAWGWSLRGTERKVTLERLDFTKAKREQEAKKPLAFTKGDARAQSLMNSPKEAQKEYAAAVKAFKAESKSTAKVTSKSTTRSTAKTTSRVAKLPPGAGSIAQFLQPVTVTKKFDDSWGDKSVFAADVNASLTFTGTQTSAAVSGQAGATCSILGNTETLLLATADITAPRTGSLSANVKVTTLGVDQVVLSQSQSGEWTKTDTFSRSLPDSFKVQYNTSIGPIPITAAVGAKGSVSVPYFVGVVPGQAMGWMIPNVQSSVYAQAGIGIEYDDTGFVAGAELDLTLLNNKLVLFASAKQGTDAKGTFLNYSLVSRDDVKALAGSLNFVINAEVLGHGVTVFSKEIFNFAGIQRTFTPLSGGETVYLHRPELKVSEVLRR
jgi:hypothetical protein